MVLLAAILAAGTLTMQSGVLGGSATPKNSPTATSSTKAKHKYYRVKVGDTMGGIAAKLGVTVDALLNANPRVSSTTIQPGDKLVIPPK